tara:strand:+ start:427 stop:585 length:159 start_codon:yes stop_codon:yes gene_type:complete
MTLTEEEEQVAYLTEQVDNLHSALKRDLTDRQYRLMCSLINKEIELESYCNQ